MLFEALAGRPPFTGTSIEVLAEKQRSAPPRLRDVALWAPDDLADLVADLLCAAPERRPPARRWCGGSARRVIRGGAPRPGGAGRSAAAAACRARRRRRRRRGRGARGARRRARAGAEGRPGLVLVQGAAAAKGARSCALFLDGEAGDALVLEGRCHEREQVPFRALDGAIDALSRHLVRTPAGRGRRAHAPRRRRARLASFAVLARVRPCARRRRSRRRGAQRKRARSGSGRALRPRWAICSGGSPTGAPFVVFIDDAHWGDAESASLLAEIAASPDPAALLLIVAHRPEDAGASPLLSALRTSPAMAAVHTVEIDLTETPARRSPPGARGSSTPSGPPSRRPRPGSGSGPRPRRRSWPRRRRAQAAKRAIPRSSNAAAAAARGATAPRRSGSAGAAMAARRDIAIGATHGAPSRDSRRASRAAPRRRASAEARVAGALARGGLQRCGRAQVMDQDAVVLEPRQERPGDLAPAVLDLVRSAASGAPA